MLKYNIRTRSLAHPGTIEDLLALENDVVPFDRADVLGAPGRSRRETRLQGCRQAFLGDSLRSPRPSDLLACQFASETERSWPGQVSIIMSVLIDVS